MTEKEIEAIERAAAHENCACVPDRIHALIGGALFDFMGYLTSRDERITLSAYDWARPAVDALGEWAEKRGLCLNVADVADWHQSLAAAPAAPTEGARDASARQDEREAFEACCYYAEGAIDGCIALERDDDGDYTDLDTDDAWEVWQHATKWQREQGRPAQADTPNPLCGLSWSGFNLQGDEASIKEVQRLMHCEHRMECLQAEVLQLRQQVQADAAVGTAVVHQPIAWITTVQIGGGPEDPPDWDTVAAVGDTPPDDRHNWAPLYAHPDPLLAECVEALEKLTDNAEQYAFEVWLRTVTPSGDAESVQRQWEESSDFRDFADEWKPALAILAKVQAAKEWKS